MKSLCLLSAALAVCVPPAHANVTVSTPTNNAAVVSPFLLNASASPCSTQAIASMGYSLDSSTNTIVVYAAKITENVIATAGSHILHVKSWGKHGASCVTNISIMVTTSPTAAVPQNAIVAGGIQTLKTWQAAYDTGSGSGSSTGTMSLVTAPSVSGTAREFLTTYTNYGGER